MVGAIIVKENEILGQGFHKIFGGEHAEIIALNSSNKEVAGGILYVNLEPCCHQGKQPPCVNRIVESGIKKVVIGMRDPNPHVSGKGVKYLQNHGLEVKEGIAEDACLRVNEAYIKHVVTGLPLSVIKIAQTLDGRIAARNGHSKWITSEKSRRYVHKLRTRHDAVLIGIGTALADNPALTVRLTKGVSPRRIVLDSKLRIPLTTKLLSDDFVRKTIIATTSIASSGKIKSIEELGATVWVINTNNEGHVDLEALWKKIGKEGIASVLVEGGSQIYSALLTAKLVDKVNIFLAPKILGDGLSAIQKLGNENLSDAINLDDFRTKQIGHDIMLTGRIKSE